MFSKHLNILLLTLLSGSLLFAIHFNGTGINILYLAIASFFLLCTLMLSLFQHLRVDQQWPKPGWPHFMALLWIIYLFINITWSQVPGNSWFYSWVIASFPVGFLLIWLMKDYCPIPKTGFTLLTIILFYAGWAIAEFLTTARSTFGPTLYQGIFGALFPSALIPVIAILIQKPAKSKWLPTVLFVLLLALFSTYSRGSLLSYLMVLPLLFFIAWRQGYAIRKTAAITLLLTLTAFGAISLYGNLMEGQVITNKIGEITAPSSMNARLMLWQAMLEIWRDHPWLGTGLASFSVMYRSYRNPAEHSAGHYGHNDYLQFLQEGGPLLLLFALLPLLLIGRILWLGYRKQATLNTIAFALASATLFIHAAADIIFYSFGPMLLGGLLLGLAWHSVENSSPLQTIKLEKPRLTLGAIGGGLLIFWLCLAADSLISAKMEWQYYLGKAYPMTIPPIEELTTLHELRPNHPSPLIRLAEAFIFLSKEAKSPEKQQKLSTPALYYSLKYLQRYPRTHQLYLRLAQLVHKQPKLEPSLRQLLKPYGIQATEALYPQLLRKTLLLEPQNRQASLSLADYYQQQKQPQKALNVLAEAKKWLKTGKTLFSPAAIAEDQKLEQRILKAHDRLKSKLTLSDAGL
jgi:O-antigen ligase